MVRCARAAWRRSLWSWAAPVALLALFAGGLSGGGGELGDSTKTPTPVAVVVVQEIAVYLPATVDPVL